MDHNIIYLAKAWPDFTMSREMLEKTLLVIPKKENRRNVAAAFPGLADVHIYTISDLITRFICSTGGSGLITEYQAEAILGRILSDSFASYLNMEQYRQSYGRALAAFIHDFRSISLQDLKPALSDLKKGKLSMKEKDLSRIYEAYAACLSGHGYDLRSGLLEFLYCTREGNGRSLLGMTDKDRILFYGFDSINPLETAFMEAVFQYASPAALVCCYDPQAPEQAKRIGNSFAPLLNRLSSLGAETKHLPQTGSRYYTQLSKGLYQTEHAFTCEYKVEETDPGITFTQTDSRFQEIVSVARQIRQLMDKGVPLTDIRIVTPDYPRYTALIQEIFPEYGIPYDPAQGIPLLRFPLARLLLQLVQHGIAPNPYLLREKILSSPYMRFREMVSLKDLMEYQAAIGTEMLDQVRLAACFYPGTYTLDFSYVHHLRQESFRTLKPLPATPVPETVCRYIEEHHRSYPDAMENLMCRALIQLYLLSCAEKALSAFPARLDAGTFGAALKRILDRFHIVKNISSDTGYENKLLESADHAVLGKVIQILSGMETEPTYTGTPDRRHTLPEYAALFARRLDEAVLYREEYGSAPGPAISVQPIWGQYQRWRHTFLCGMADGEFPTTEKFNFLEPKKDGLSLGRPYTAVDYGRSSFYQMVGATLSGLYLSRPLSDGGKRLTPSPFLLDFEKLIPLVKGRRCDDEEVLYSLREQLLYTGRHVDVDYEKARPVLKAIKADRPDDYKHIEAVLRYDGLTQNAVLSEFDGLLSTSASPVLAKVLKSIRFTPKNLERYASCPFRFLYDDILGFKSKPDYDTDNTDAAKLLHTLLRAYTEKACEDGSVPENAAYLLKEALQYRLNSIDTPQDAFHTRYVQGLTAGLDDPETRPKGLLTSFLEYEKKGPDLLSPYWGALSGFVTIEDGLKVQVEADRVDIADPGCLLAFVYTVSDTGSADKVRRGLRFDLPLTVLLVMDAANGQGLQNSIAGAGLYLVKSPRVIRRTGYFAMEALRAARQTGVCSEKPLFSGRADGFLSVEAFREALIRCTEHIGRLHRLMHEGIYHLPLCQPAEQPCLNCGFSRVCRKEPLRLERLRSAVAKDVNYRATLNWIEAIF